MMTEELANISLSAIREPHYVMRFVDTEDVEYWELRDSIRAHGVLSSITVRRCKDDQGKFELIAGLHRFTACKELGRDTIPATIIDVDDDDFLILQLQENAIRPKVERTEYARQVQHILTRNPAMSFAELASRIGKSPGWVKDHLGLLTLGEELQKKVDRGEMPATNAFWLAKIPTSIRDEYETLSLVSSVAEFTATAKSVIKQHSEAVMQRKRKGKAKPTFTPHPHLRPMGDIQFEQFMQKDGPELVGGCQTPLEGFYAALEWVQNLDPKSVARQRQRVNHREMTNDAE